jgi:hypothetical protein
MHDSPLVLESGCDDNGDHRGSTGAAVTCTIAPRPHASIPCKNRAATGKMRRLALDLNQALFSET